ncbi:hypothetical protein JR316_0005875 [Psilocybe cubensis]|uniref:Uncharacterized protein n=2 Tax=Psilocybe cubensis TaxID=181762 RepID=A0ACB8H0T4_PSICU|nr:hypothetical protein JR316_0005875 [Psilocybe cubensis]KAH9481350.1 hypothetical protein JR316_0005875 [Psilocybe cubensis]
MLVQDVPFRYYPLQAYGLSDPWKISHHSRSQIHFCEGKKQALFFAWIQETSYLKGIRCIPFTTSPFSVLKLIDTAAGRTLTLGPDSLYVKSSRIYDRHASPTSYASVKIDRFQAAAIARSHNRPLPRVFNNGMKDHDVSLIDNGNEVIDFGNPFKRLNGTFMTNNESNITIGLFEAYLWHILGSYENVKKLESLGSLASDEDSRIHEMTAKEMAKRKQALQDEKDRLLNFMKTRNISPTKENVRQRTSKLGVWSKYKTSPETRRTSGTATQEQPTTQPSQKKSGNP